MDHQKAEKAAKRIRTSGLPKDEQLPRRLDFDATIPLPDFQTFRLARRFGLAPTRAALIAGLVFGEARQ